jgi:hypothetical protein
MVLSLLELSSIEKSSKNGENCGVYNEKYGGYGDFTQVFIQVDLVT